MARAQAAKILIIDDDRTFTTMMSSLLQSAGYKPVVAFDAMQGFMFAQRDPPTLVLLDISMPAGGGMQLLEKLRKSSKTQNVPVIIVTGTGDARLESDAKAKGAVAVVKKPVDSKGFVELVKQTIESED